MEGVMDNHRKLDFLKVTNEDVDTMTAVMKRAFDEDSRRFLGRGTGGPPGYDNGEFIRKWYLGSGADAFKVCCEGKLIGGMNIFHNGNHAYFLGNMFVDPDCQDQGVGTAIWKFIESQYPDATKWATETPGFSKRNHHFYVNKCGFHVVRIDNPKDAEEESYILEKQMA